MPKHRVDDLLRALADPTRRAMVERLGEAPTSVSDLARPFGITLAAVIQHLAVLEKAGIVQTEKTGRVRVCRLAPGGLDLLGRWIEAQRSPAERMLDRLQQYLKEEDRT